MLVDGALRQAVRPLEEEGHTHTALKVIALRPAQRTVRADHVADVVDASVVGEKHDQSVPLDAVPAQRIHDIADHVVHRGDHGREDSGALPLDVEVPVHVFDSRLNRSVRRIGSQHQEEGLARVALDEIHGAVGERVGQVLLDLDHLEAVQNLPDVPRTLPSSDDRSGPGDGIRRRAVEIAGAAPEVAEELIEAAVQRVVLLQCPEVPLADQPRHVAGAAHQVAKRGLPFRQAQLRVGPAHIVVRGIVLVPEAILVAPGKEAGPGRTADGCRDVAVGQSHALPGQAVDVRGGDHFGPVGPDVAVPEVIGNDDHDIGAGAGFRVCGAGGQLAAAGQAGQHKTREKRPLAEQSGFGAA